MKLTIDLHQSPIALRKELDDVVRFALGSTFFIDQADIDEQGNFTHAELTDPAINVPNGLPALPLAPGALAPLTPTTSGATAAPAASGVEVDTAGDPYDVRIHSAGKSKIANGTWKLKKGVDKALVEQIKAQNKALVATPLPTTTPDAATTLPAGAGALPPLTTAAALPSLPPVPPVAAPDAEIVVTDYPSFAQFVGQQVAKHGQKATDELNRGLTHYGLVDPTTQTPQLPLMAHRPDIVDPFYKWFKTVLGA